MTGKCAIWGTPADVRREANVDATRVDSPRAGGSYRISGPARVEIRHAALDDQTKAKLTTILIDLRGDGEAVPTVNSEVVERSPGVAALRSSDRANRLLRYVADRESQGQGEPVWLAYTDSGALAMSESWNQHQTRVLFEHLEKQGFLTSVQRALEGAFWTVTVNGHNHLDETWNPATTQVFVAMWFSDEMRDAYESGIAPGIRDAGFEPLRIDEQRDVDKIDDAILAEIDKSRFVVADMTHGADGVRGSVYYEAGYARGLGRDVIYCCRKDCVDGLPFDTRQHRHIVWEAPTDLRSELTETIRARIGDPPRHDIRLNLTAKAKRSGRGMTGA